MLREKKKGLRCGFGCIDIRRIWQNYTKNNQKKREQQPTPEAVLNQGVAGGGGGVC